MEEEKFDMPTIRSQYLLVLSSCILIVLANSAFAESPLLVRLDQRPSMGDAVPQPVAIWQETRKLPRPLATSCMRIDLKNPRYEFSVMVADDPDGQGPAEAALTPPGELLVSHNALAGVNANAFTKVRSEDRMLPWQEGMHVNVVGLACSDAAVRSPLGDSRDANSRTPFWLDSNMTPRLGIPTRLTDMRQGVGDFCATLLQEGRVIPKPGGVRHPRTALGSDETGRFLFLAVFDGRRAGYSDGLSMYELAKEMQSLGCRDAINLDGGGSSIMLYRDEASGELTTVNRPSGDSHRPIPTMIGVRARQDSKR